MQEAKILSITLLIGVFVVLAMQVFAQSPAYTITADKTYYQILQSETIYVNVTNNQNGQGAAPRVNLTIYFNKAKANVTTAYVWDNTRHKKWVTVQTGTQTVYVPSNSSGADCTSPMWYVPPNCAQTIPIYEQQQQEDWYMDWDTVQTNYEKKKGKNVPANFDGVATVSDKISWGETKKFKFDVVVPTFEQGKFYYEVIDSNGKDGLLDPWWNSQWTAHYPITILSGNGSHTNEVIIVNVSAVNCTYTNKRDLRILLNNTTQIPFQYSVDGQEIIFRANITGAASTNTEHSAYCSNPDATWANTTTLFLLTETFNNESMKHWTQPDGWSSVANNTTKRWSKENYSGEFNSSGVNQGANISYPFTSGTDYWLAFDYNLNSSNPAYKDIYNYNMRLVFNYTGLNCQGANRLCYLHSSDSGANILSTYTVGRWYSFNTHWKAATNTFDINYTSTQNATVSNTSLTADRTQGTSGLKLGSTITDMRAFADRIFMSTSEIQLYPYSSNTSIGTLTNMSTFSVQADSITHSILFGTFTVSIWNTTYTATEATTNNTAVFLHRNLPPDSVNMKIVKTNFVTIQNNSVNIADLNYTIYHMSPAYTNISVYDETNETKVWYNLSLSSASMTRYNNNSNSDYSCNPYIWNNESAIDCPSGDLTLKVSSRVYPERKWYFTRGLSDTTQRDAFMLDTAKGIYVRFHITDCTLNTKSNVRVSASKIHSNTSYVTVDEDETDNSGTATLFLDPDVSYRIKVNDSGTVETDTITPTQQDFTKTIGCDGGTFNPIKSFAEIKYTFTPDGNRLLPVNNTATTFNTSAIFNVNFTLTATGNNLANYGLNVTLPNGTNLLFINRTGASGGQINAYFTIQNAREGNNVSVIGFFQKTSYSTEYIYRTYFLSNQTAGKHSLIEIFKDTFTLGNTGFTKGGAMLFALLFTAIVIIMVGGASGNSSLGMIIGLGTLGFFTFIGWFNPLLYIFIAIAGVSLAVLRSSWR